MDSVGGFMSTKKTTQTSKRPTKKQKELLTFVENFIAGHGYGPSYREIRAGLGYNSVATVAKHVDNLILRGHLRKQDHSARSLELVAHKENDEQKASRVKKTEKDHQQWLIEVLESKVSDAEEEAQADKKTVDQLQTLEAALKIIVKHSEQIEKLSQRIEALKASLKNPTKTNS